MNQLCIAVTILILAAHGALAQPTGSGDAGCLAPLRTVERQQKLPAEMLQTVALVESGRVQPGTNRTVPWPWTINVDGTGYFFETKQEAIAAVIQWQALGRRSIDVGCMQINLRHHPQAFATLDDAFDPLTNVTYGARFLTSLRLQFGAWPTAIAGYHSQTPDIGAPYWDKVLASWRFASRYTDGLPLRAQGGTVTAAKGPPPIATNSPELARRLAEVQQDHRRNLAGVGAATRLAGWPASERLAMNAMR